MHNYIALIFNDTGKAYKALHALWQMDGEGDITVHGATVVHRNNWGEFQVDTKETEPAMATAFGVAIGALLGALAGPAGAAVCAPRRTGYRPPSARRGKSHHDLHQGHTHGPSN